MNTLMLSRIQFGLTVSFHYLFPLLSIGLGVMMVIMEGMYLKTSDQKWERMARFWTGIFALTFGLGVATGIVMEFEFGTNWANYSRFVGDIFGAPLAAEGIFAFFLESGFLSILLFGWDRVGRKMHFFATAMVSLGSIFSAVWINVANSWMQTPLGFQLVKNAQGKVVGAKMTNFWQVVLNHSTIDRLEHVLIGAFLSGAFLVISVAAWYLLKNRHLEIARSCMKIGLIVAIVCSLLQLLTGDFNARMIAKYQPAKLAAFEGAFPASAPEPLGIVGWVDQVRQKVYGLKIPGMLSWLLYGNTSRPVEGLDAFPAKDWPPVNPVFQSYHAMVALGMFLILISFLATFFWWRGTLWNKRWLLWILVFSVVAPLAANELGWFSAEVGRQPWIVYGILRTSQGVSPGLPAGDVLTSIIMFGILYALLFALFIYMLNRKIQHGPVDAPLRVPSGQPLPHHARMDA